MSRARRPTLRAEALVLRGLGSGMRRLPVRRRVQGGQMFGQVMWRANGRRRRLATRNVQSALGVDSYQARRIARGAFGHFGRFFAECLCLPDYARPGREALFRIEGLEHLREAASRGRGVVVYSGHLGNWELVALRQALEGFPLDLITRPMHNPWVDSLLREWREVSGNRVLSKHGVLRRAVEGLREGRCLAMLIDQHESGPRQLRIPFFGQPAATTPSLGRLAVRLEVPVVPVCSTPEPDGGYRIAYHAPLEPSRSGSPDEQAEETTRRALAILEGWIREQPETWLWLHDRWKTKTAREEVGP